MMYLMFWMYLGLKYFDLFYCLQVCKFIDEVGGVFGVYSYSVVFARSIVGNAGDEEERRGERR